MPAKSKRPGTPFQTSWPLSYGIEVSERDAKTKEVKSALCRFCKYFGRKPAYDENRKRKPTTKAKFFSPPWRTDTIIQHLEDQHPDEWNEYLAADNSLKSGFFDGHIARSNTRHKYMDL